MDSQETGQQQIAPHISHTINLCFKFYGLTRKDTVGFNMYVLTIGSGYSGYFNPQFLAREYVAQGGGGTDITYGKPRIAIEYTRPGYLPTGGLCCHWSGIALR